MRKFFQRILDFFRNLFRHNKKSVQKHATIMGVGVIKTSTTTSYFLRYAQWYIITPYIRLRTFFHNDMIRGKKK